MTRHCPICTRESLMGFHPLCILKSARINPIEKIDRSVPTCPRCPFRKDKPGWMDKGRILMNLLRLKFGTTQCCHHDPHGTEGSLCGGFQRCRIGGDENTLSPEELKNLEPVAPEGVQKAYYYDNEKQQRVLRYKEAKQTIRQIKWETKAERLTEIKEGKRKIRTMVKELTKEMEDHYGTN